MLDKIRESSKYLAPFVKGEHSIGIILGTGLGEINARGAGFVNYRWM